MTQFLPSPIKSTDVFEQMANQISINFKCISPNCRKTEQQHNLFCLPFSFAEAKRQKYFCCLYLVRNTTKHNKVSSETQKNRASENHGDKGQERR